MKQSALKLNALAAALLFSSMTYAATKEAVSPKWQQEPTTFLGINLSGNLKSDVRPCTVGDALTEICWYPVTDDLYNVWGTPKIGISNPKLSVKLKDSKIQSITLQAYEYQFPKLRDLLVQRYGKPTSSSSEVVKTKAGASFNNERLFWKGEKISMILSHYGIDIDTSSFTIFNDSVTEKAKIDGENSLKEAASKL